MFRILYMFDYLPVSFLYILSLKYIYLLRSELVDAIYLSNSLCMIKALFFYRGIS